MVQTRLTSSGKDDETIAAKELFAAALPIGEGWILRVCLSYAPFQEFS